MINIAFMYGNKRGIKAGVHVCKYLVHVSSNPETICLKLESTLRGILQIFVDFGYAWEENIFLKRFVKFRKIRNIEHFGKFAVNN